MDWQNQACKLLILAINLGSVGTLQKLMEKQLKEAGISILEHHCERMEEPPFYEGVGDPITPTLPPKVKFNSRMYF